VWGGVKKEKRERIELKKEPRYKDRFKELMV
jgi:hypothetical protein